MITLDVSAVVALLVRDRPEHTRAVGVLALEVHGLLVLRPDPLAELVEVAHCHAIDRNGGPSGKD